MITLKTLPQATAQEVFDQVARHMVTQNAPSIGHDGGCAYRGEGNMMCAAGCLIADDEYKPEFDDNVSNDTTWDYLVNNFPEIIPDTHRGLIRSLQIVHDSDLVDEWVSSLKELAVKFNLKMIDV